MTPDPLSPELLGLERELTDRPQPAQLYVTFIGTISGRESKAARAALLDPFIITGTHSQPTVAARSIRR